MPRASPWSNSKLGRNHRAKSWRPDRVAKCGVSKLLGRRGPRPGIFSAKKKALGKGTTMETVLQGLGALRGVPGEEGMTGLARLLAEACANEITDAEAEADALCEATGTTRDGCRGRPLETQFGTLTPRILKLRAGIHFPGSPTGRRGARGPRRHLRGLRDTRPRRVHQEGRPRPGENGRRRGRRAGPPRLPRGARAPHARRQRPGAPRPRDQAPHPRGAEPPVRSGAGKARGRCALRGRRRLVGRASHRPGLGRRALGAVARRIHTLAGPG